MLTKPDDIFDRSMEWAALSAFAERVPLKPQLGVITGRRRQGKTYLLQAIVRATGGFYFGATQATDTESLRLFRAALETYLGEPIGRFDNWDDAIKVLFSQMQRRVGLVVLDEFSYLTKASPELPSIIQREFDAAVFAKAPVSLLLCGSAMSVMGGLLSGQAPLRGRANLELVVQPFSYRSAAEFWGIDDPRLALMTHSVVGGTAAYREFVNQDFPSGLIDFDAWVNRTILNPTAPLCREARYLLDEEADIPDTALYHSILAAVAGGNNNAGNIAGYVGRKSTDIAYPMKILEDCQLLRKEPDMFRKNRPRYRMAEPLITFYNAIMRPQWSLIETGAGPLVWRNAQSRYLSQVVGPHFEQLCREYAQTTDRFGELPGVVGAGVVPDPAKKSQIEIDVAVFAPEDPRRPRRILSLGETKWGEVMGGRQVARLARARDLLDVAGYDVSACRLACYSAKGFEPKILDDPDIETIDLNQLYQ